MEDEIINRLFYIITPELARNFLSLSIKYQGDSDFIDIVKMKLKIDENLALYLESHLNAFDSYFNEDSSTRFYKNKKLDKELQEPMFDKKGDYLPKFDNETIYIKKSDISI